MSFSIGEILNCNWITSTTLLCTIVTLLSKFTFPILIVLFRIHSSHSLLHIRFGHIFGPTHTAPLRHESISNCSEYKAPVQSSESSSQLHPRSKPMPEVALPQSSSTHRHGFRLLRLSPLFNCFLYTVLHMLIHARSFSVSRALFEVLWMPSSFRSFHSHGTVVLLSL